MVGRVSLGGLLAPGEVSSIVETLRSLGTSVPIGLLAGYVGRSEADVRKSLKVLSEAHAVVLDKDRDTVKLVA